MSKVSIIVPIYNVEKYLRECLDSIIAQTFTDWECLLIDDGSPDKCGEICDEYAAKDCRFKVFHKPNGGVSSARNLGLDKACGEWVTFVDADDMIAPDFLSALVEPTFKHEDLDFVHAGCCNYRDGKIVEIEQKYEPYYGSDPAYLFNKFRGLTVSKLFRLENVTYWSDGLPLRFDENRRIAEDMAFTLDYILNVNHYAFVYETGYLYRRDNEGSATKQKRIPDFEEELHAFKALYESTKEYAQHYHLSENESEFRLSQRGTELQQVCLALYRGKYSRMERIRLLKYNFVQDELFILKYARGGWLKNLIFLLLQKRMYVFFDAVTIVLMRIKNK